MEIKVRFNPDWNAHYDFSHEANLAEIEKVESYDIANDLAGYTDGEIIHSPWGTNRVMTLTSENGEDICIKEITVNPGYMLSLQRHRGRAELWEVTEGTLGVICNGEYSEISAGGSMTLPQGAVHCMLNPTDEIVTVRETQRGKCRERDNIRLADYNGRPIYPLTSEIEFKSAKLYEEVRARIAQK